jgi:hypothetical protein
MAMGLPVITTNWGGSTEFVTPTSGLLINVTELIETSGGERQLSCNLLMVADDWLGGHRWAKIDLQHLQLHLRALYNDRSDFEAY